MKVGTKVWVYIPLTQEIVKGEITRVTEIGYDVLTSFRDHPYFFLKREIFPTRKALCEYYRKIFE